jgi:hypothetical protein
MRIVTHLTKFYNWISLPADVREKMSEDDIKTALAAGILKPGAKEGYLMRVEVDVPTHNTALLSEADIIGKIIHEKTGRDRMKRTFTRRQAAAHLLSENVLVSECEADWISHFEVHDDGPDEALLRDTLAPHFKAINPRTGKPNINPEHLDAHVAAYTEKASAEDHVTHLHQHFGVAAKAVS